MAPLIETHASSAPRKRALLTALRADTYRQFGRFSWGCLLRGFLTRRTLRPVISLRLCQHAPRALRPVFVLLHRLTCGAAGLDLPWRTQIAPGLALMHGWGVVVSPGVRIATNVTLFHGVTLGRRDRIARDGTRTTDYPVIEDEVWIGPHAVIVGGVTIGRGSRIAAGAFVTQDVPPHSVVQGNPAVIVKSNCMPDVSFCAPVAAISPG